MIDDAAVDVIDDAADHLTSREEQVLRLVADGLYNKEIARALVISEHTVKNHLTRMFVVAGVHSRLSLVIWALQRGQINLEEIELG